MSTAKKWAGIGRKWNYQLQNLGEKKKSLLKNKFWVVLWSSSLAPPPNKKGYTKVAWNEERKVTVTAGTKKLALKLYLHVYIRNVAYAKFLINLEE